MSGNAQESVIGDVYDMLISVLSNAIVWRYCGATKLCVSFWYVVVCDDVIHVWPMSVCMYVCYVLFVTKWPVMCAYVSQDYTDSPPDSREVIVVMDSFKSKIIRLRVRWSLWAPRAVVYC